MEKVEAMASQEGVIQPVIQAPSSLIPKEVVTDFWNAIKSDNPILKLVLGLCSVLAISTSVQNALGMSLAATFVLVGSNVVISLIRKQIPSKVRIPAFIVVIAAFVTLVDLLMAAYSPHLYEQLGIFIPLIVVNCIILARADAFAARQPVSRALADGLGMGLGYTIPLLMLGGIREIFGSGTLAGFSLFGSNYVPMVMMLLPAGAFIVLGLMVALFNTFINPKQLAYESYGGPGG
ncbi:MAG TPA: electron transport complex subunit E [Nitrospiria bacterium]|nr:electron transport complex subunit E [Nitrospiria bacterium]